MVPRDSWWGSDDDILRHLQSARQEGYRQGIEDALAWGGMIPAEARDLTNNRRKAPSAAALARENERLRNAADTRAEAEARIAALEAEVAALKADLATRPPAPSGLAMAPKEASRLPTKRFRNLEFD